MLSRGIMTRKQYNTLFSLKSNGGPHNTCMMWILIRCLNGMKDGTIPNDPSLREILFDKFLDLRGTIGSVGDLLDGTIPLAYAHFVQLLVDSFLVIAPFALYAELGVWSVPAVGLLTLFYSGLLDLSKILLDPLDNEEFYQESVNMDIGVLIRESNAGSTRWKSGVETLPF
jgi:predicted membrane chloride channel (bestrophin family)